MFQILLEFTREKLEGMKEAAAECQDKGWCFSIVKGTRLYTCPEFSIDQSRYFARFYAIISTNMSILVDMEARLTISHVGLVVATFLFSLVILINRALNQSKGSSKK